MASFPTLSRRPLSRLATIAAVSGLSLLAATQARAVILYSINSFDPDDATTTSSTTVAFDPALVSITVFPGLTGTTAQQLLTLQTLNPNAGTAIGGIRFQNTDSDIAQSNQTLITDASATGYFQFGVSGGNGALTLDNLVFDAKKATAAVATRGFNITASVNGGAYQPLGAANLTNDRNTATFDNVSLPLTGAGFQNISSVDFRVFSTGGGIEYRDFAINGNIPEPASMSLAAIGTAGLLGYRRRRRA